MFRSLSLKCPRDVIASPYIQDRWKVTKRLTITVGLRILDEPEPHATPDTDAAFNPTVYNPAQGPRLVAMAKNLGWRKLHELTTIIMPETLLGWPPLLQT